MFNFQGQEIFIILVLALIVLGPERLPEAMRKLGNFVAEIRKMTGGFQEEFKAVVDEPMRQMRESVDLIREQTDIRKWQSSDSADLPNDPDAASNTSNASTGVPVAPSNPTPHVPTFETDDVSEPSLIDDTEPFKAVSSRATDLREATSRPATGSADTSDEPDAVASTSTTDTATENNGDAGDRSNSQLLRDFEYSQHRSDGGSDGTHSGETDA